MHNFGITHRAHFPQLLDLGSPRPILGNAIGPVSHREKRNRVCVCVVFFGCNVSVRSISPTVHFPNSPMVETPNANQPGTQVHLGLPYRVQLTKLPNQVKAENLRARKEHTPRRSVQHPHLPGFHFGLPFCSAKEWIPKKKRFFTIHSFAPPLSHPSTGELAEQTKTTHPGCCAGLSFLQMPRCHFGFAYRFLSHSQIPFCSMASIKWCTPN